MLTELVADIGDLWCEDLFFEVLEYHRVLFMEHDNRITNSELQVFSNVTYLKAANSVDKVRWDGTAMIDNYYLWLSGLIQSNELTETHSTEWELQVLPRAKYEW